MSDSLEIIYDYDFGDNLRKKFTVRLDRTSLNFIREQDAHAATWTALENKQCGSCPLNAAEVPNCPVALNFSGIAAEFHDYFAYQTVKVTVTTAERSFFKDTTIQEGLSPLLGIIMVTSGCPVMERLKPMVRFHLPFATLEETIFRMVSMYLVAQLFLQRKNQPSELGIDGLLAIYSEVEKVNEDFAKRILDAAKKDANVNALVNLSIYASMIPLAIEDILDQIEGYFSAYLT